jgi:peptidoglycan/LPS O-acetylase OafA/YrhL
MSERGRHERTEKQVRPEIQALRAVAVALVVVYHLWPESLPGGFVGVDVFFAISGYLITSLLLREIDRTGKLSLPQFYARRARRILPASLVTLGAVGIVTILFVPLSYWSQFFGDLTASTTYVQNWHLSAAAVDYFAADQGPSPVQHFWSLSAEEQFYIVWPALLVLSVAATRHAPHRRRPLIATVMALLTAGSLGYSLWATAANPAAAYFVTPTRAWEFGVGGLLALVSAPRAEPSHARAALSWLGLAAIAYAAVAFTNATAFPGMAAMVPVAGALAVMQAGMPTVRWAPSAALRVRPVQFVGDVSYSVYLWHWPLLVLIPIILGGALHTSTKLTIVALTLLLAWLSKLLVEDPARTAAFLTRRRNVWTYAVAASTTAVVLAINLAGASHVRTQIRAAEQQSAASAAATPRCFGAASRDPEVPCTNPALRLSVVPLPVAARSLPNPPCRRLGDIEGKQVCAFGAPAARAKRTIALVGDSHAGMWRVALDPVARKLGLRGVHMGHASCPLTKALRDLPEPNRTHCIRWKQKIFQWFEDHPEADTLLVSQLTGGSGVVPTGGRSEYETQVAGYVSAWKALPPSVRRVVVIRDTPKTVSATPACVERALERRRPPGPACAIPRERALDRDPAVDAARRAGASTIDLTSAFCDDRRCFPVVGGALVYRDTTHMLPAFGRSLAPQVQRRLETVLTRGPRPAPTVTLRLASARTSATPRCFGAATLDPRRPCRNAQLRRSVTPTPAEALTRPNSPCTVTSVDGLVRVCAFGAAAEASTATVALVGDSHASHWRAALDHVAGVRRWRGLSITHSACPLSRATRNLDTARRTSCDRWRRDLFAWFKRHPEVTTVFTVALSGGSGVVPTRGRSEFETALDGYRRAWRSLPRSVKRIVVIRDTPKADKRAAACIERAMAARRVPGTTCARARATALDRDAAAVAARRLRSPRVRTVDLLHYFCGRRTCAPVIGGALVYKDTSHLTAVYMTTVGPYLERAVRRIDL